MNSTLVNVKLILHLLIAKFNLDLYTMEQIGDNKD